MTLKYTALLFFPRRKIHIAAIILLLLAKMLNNSKSCKREMSDYSINFRKWVVKIFNIDTCTHTCNKRVTNFADRFPDWKYYFYKMREVYSVERYLQCHRLILIVYIPRILLWSIVRYTEAGVHNFREPGRPGD